MPTTVRYYKDGEYVEVNEANPLPVSGSSAGGYTEGDADTSITGTAFMWEDASDVLRPVSATKPLPIQQAALAPTVDQVALGGRATGGLSTFCSIDLDESEEEVKATAGTVYSISAFNRTASPLYLKLYNATAANTTVGTTTPQAVFVIPANADSDGAGFLWNNDLGLAFSTATSAASSGPRDLDDPVAPTRRVVAGGPGLAQTLATGVPEWDFAR